jgi:hypothetical protein
MGQLFKTVVGDGVTEGGAAEDCSGEVLTGRSVLVGDGVELSIDPGLVAELGT